MGILEFLPLTLPSWKKVYLVKPVIKKFPLQFLSRFGNSGINARPCNGERYVDGWHKDTMLK